MSRTIRKWFRKVKAGVDYFPRSRHRTVGVALIGLSLILVGMVMIVLPGPGLLVAAAGLALLSTEFIWAQTIVRKMRNAVVYAKRRKRSRTLELRRVRTLSALRSAAS